ncbi:MAG: glycoside hydrolase family 25 protein [Ruminococcus sp.]|jgi:GH25 family lysozyme M1 (1,4-beta-N-acetylmuramidase)|nr:glycoside hydrolase family 25 protein [Ruminococcus sp.]
MAELIIDVSKHNGNIDWKKVKAAGVTGVIIRAGYGKLLKQKDACFEKNYAGAKSVGLPVGAYWYSYAVDVAAAKQEAEVCLEVIKDKSFEYPIYFDIEDKCHLKLSKATCTAITEKFCTELEKNKYFAGVYSFDSFFVSYLESSIQDKFSCWAARVEKVRPTYCKKFAMWQYSWKGKIDGIKGDVDCNEAYKNFPNIMKKNKLNGCK